MFFRFQFGKFWRFLIFYKNRISKWKTTKWQKKWKNEKSGTEVEISPISIQTHVFQISILQILKIRYKTDND